MQAFEALNTRLEGLCAAVPDGEALAARNAKDRDMAQRMDETSKALNLAASKIIGAVVDIQTVKRGVGDDTVGVAERIDALAAQQAEIVTALGGLTGLLDGLVIRTVEDRNEAVTEMLARMDDLRESIGVIQTALGPSSAYESVGRLKDAHDKLLASLGGTESANASSKKNASKPRAA
jgi:hypothetical protein